MAESACKLSLTEVALAIREKQLSCVEVATACLERIEQCQPLWNAFIHVEPEAALAAARKADAALARGEILGPLHGVPMGHKDTCFRRGRLATCGSRVRSQFIPECTATVLGRLDAAGALDLGGVNTSDSGCNPFGFNVLAGRARNPWDPERVTGGSSSAGIPVEHVLRATIPFLIPLMVSLIVITVFPGLSLWLPELVFGPRP